MPPTQQTQFLPETDPRTLERFGVEGPLAVRSILDDLVRENALITLYCPERHEDFVVSRLLRRDDGGLRFDFPTDESRRRALLRTGSVIVVAFLDRVKIQFESGALEALVEDGHAVLAGATPTRVVRLQRRDAFRVNPPRPHPVECIVRDVGDEEMVYRVLDLSPEGIALMVPPSLETPAAGDRWQHCRLEIPGYAPIPCDLVVRVVSETLLGDGASRRIGCSLDHPTPEAQRALQMYVMEVQSGRYGRNAR